MKSALILLAFALVAAASAVPTSDGTDIVLLQRRDLDVFGNTRKLIEELVNNLQAAAQQAIDAINSFTSGLGEQMRLFRDEIVKNIEKLRERVRAAIQDIYGRLQSIPGAIQQCIEERRDSTSALLNDTLSEIWHCADDRIAEISGMLYELGELSKSAIESGNEAIENMRQCTEINQGQLLQLGSCLSNVAIQTQVKVAGFAARSGSLLFRINLAIGSLPAVLQFCAGARLLQAGARIAQVVVEIGRCSVASIQG